MTEPRDLVHDFAELAADTSMASLPPEACDAAKKSILDTLGVILAASGMEPSVRSAVNVARQAGGAPEASVLAFGGKLPAMMAAFCNGAMAHCLDYDDQTPWGQHCASSIVPAVFALAELKGGVSGAEMICAVASAQDIFSRLRCHVGWNKDWNLSTVLAVYAAAAAAGRVLRLDAIGIARAMGIASMQSCGVMEMVAGRGSDLRGMYAGFSAKGAVLAALLARAGIGGIERLFEGQHGVFATYFGGRYDRDAMLSGLGHVFLGSQTLYKRWPCVGTSHSHMKAAIDIITANDLSVEDIAGVRLHVGDYHALMCTPLDERRAPATLADAKFSLPFLVAIAIARRGMGVSDFTEQGLHDPQVLALGQRVEISIDPALDWKLEMPPGRVEIFARDGRRWIATGTNVPGNAENPMTWADICEKFAECARASVAPLAADRIAHAIELAREIENLPDVTALIRAVT